MMCLRWTGEFLDDRFPLRALLWTRADLNELWLIACVCACVLACIYLRGSVQRVCIYSDVNAIYSKSWISGLAAWIYKPLSPNLSVLDPPCVSHLPLWKLYITFLHTHRNTQARTHPFCVCECVCDPSGLGWSSYRVSDELRAGGTVANRTHGDFGSHSAFRSIYLSVQQPQQAGKSLTRLPSGSPNATGDHWKRERRDYFTALSASEQ